MLVRLSEADAPASAPYWLSPMPCRVMLWVPRLTVIGEILHDVVDEFAVGRQVEDLLVEDPVMPDLGADQHARALDGRARRHHRIEAADLLQRSGPGADIFERGLGHDAVLVLGPVIADFAERAVESRVVAGGRKAKPGVAARIDVAEAMHQRARPGPRPAVDGGVEAELGQVDRRRLQRQRHVDVGAALVDREADIDAGRDARADPGHAAPGLAAVADETAERAVVRRNAVALEPGAVARRFGASEAPPPPGLVRNMRLKPLAGAEPLQEIAAEIGHRGAGRDRRIDHRRRWVGRRRRRGCRRGCRRMSIARDRGCYADEDERQPRPAAPARARSRFSLVRQGRDEQRMNSIPEQKRSAQKMRKIPITRIPICAQFAGSVNRLAVARQGPNTGHCCSAATGGCDCAAAMIGRRATPADLISPRAKSASPSDAALPGVLQMSPSRRTLPLASSRSASG